MNTGRSVGMRFFKGGRNLFFEGSLLLGRKGISSGLFGRKETKKNKKRNFLKLSENMVTCGEN